MSTAKKYSFEEPAAPIPAKEIKEIVNTEIVVAGAGPAGLAAAVSAAERGAKVVLLEKYHRIAAPGGPGAPFIGSKMQKERETKAESGNFTGSMPPAQGKDKPPENPVLMNHGEDRSKDEIIKGLYEASNGFADKRKIKLWADKSGEAADWLVDMAKGLGIYVSVGRLTHMFSKTQELVLHGNRTPVGTGADDDDRQGELVLLNMMRDRGRQLGVDIRCSTAAVRLIRPSNKGRVTGIIAKKADGTYVQFNASKAVILCTGDYGMDEEMMEKYCPWALGTPKLMLDTVTGDGHKMGLWVGAAMDEAPHCPMLHFNSTNEKPVIHFRPLGMMAFKGNFLYVNKKGQRIMNEAGSEEFMANIVLRQPGKTCWQVFDAKAINDKNRADIEKCIGTGAVLQADTIEKLATKFGAQPEVFKATVDRYNELVKQGEDLDFDKKPEHMKTPVDKAPFYVCESPPDLLCTMGGFKTNMDHQVLDKELNPIPGLYAAGNITSGFWGDTYPMGFLGGISRSHALVFGRLAGINACLK